MNNDKRKVGISNTGSNVSRDIAHSWSLSPDHKEQKGKLQEDTGDVNESQGMKVL